MSLSYFVSATAVAAAFAVDLSSFMPSGQRNHLRADHPEHTAQERPANNQGCCFGEKGAYFSNFTMLGAACGHAGVGFGYVASDPDNEQAIMVVGNHDRLVEDSKFGAWARFCPDENKWYQTAWDEEECVTYALPKDYPEPYVCFGEGSRFDTYRGPSTMEGQVNIDRYAAFNKKAKGMAEVYVNQDSCAPYFLLGGSRKYNVYASVIHQNGTSTVPSEVFQIPSFCEEGGGVPRASGQPLHGPYKPSACPVSGKALGEHEGLPAHLKEAVEMGRIVLGGRE